MSEQHTEEKSDTTLRSIVAWGFAVGIGFIFGMIGLGGVSPLVLCLITAAVVFVMGMIGGEPVVAFFTAIMVGALWIVAAWFGGQVSWVGGAVSFGLGLIGVVGLALTMQRAVTGRLAFDITILYVVMSLAFPFALNGLRAYEAMGIVGI